VYWASTAQDLFPFAGVWTARVLEKQRPRGSGWQTEQYVT